MTRLIAGAYGGRTLRTPPGPATRPTSDRVREALFSALEARDAVHGARVLDLYAGSGALGLEAMSRGALSVLLVESDRRAASTIAANVAALGVRGARVLTSTVTRALAAAPVGEGVDLALLDPPYDLAQEALAQDLQRLAARWLAPGALVVLERSTRSPEPPWPLGLQRLGRPRRYGETSLWFAELAAPAASADPGTVVEPGTPSPPVADLL